MLVFIFLFSLKNSCYAIGIVDFTYKIAGAQGVFNFVKNLFSSKNELEKIKELNDFMYDEKFFPNVTSPKERAYVIGNVTCSGRNRDILLLQYCQNGTNTCDKKHTNSLKNPFQREYLYDYNILNRRIIFGKCEDR